MIEVNLLTEQTHRLQVMVAGGGIGGMVGEFGLCCYSVTKSCLTLCDPIYCSMPASLSLIISQSLMGCTLCYILNG